MCSAISQTLFVATTAAEALRLCLLSSSCMRRVWMTVNNRAVASSPAALRFPKQILRHWTVRRVCSTELLVGSPPSYSRKPNSRSKLRTAPWRNCSRPYGSRGLPPKQAASPLFSNIRINVYSARWSLLSRFHLLLESYCPGWCVRRPERGQDTSGGQMWGPVNIGPSSVTGLDRFMRVSV